MCDFFVSLVSNRSGKMSNTIRRAPIGRRRYYNNTYCYVYYDIIIERLNVLVNLYGRIMTNAFSVMSVRRVVFRNSIAERLTA